MSRHLVTTSFLLCTDTSLKDGLFHEFKKHGKVTSVQIHGASEERYGLVFFRQQEDQEKALGASKGKLFFGMQIDVTAWNGPGKFRGWRWYSSCLQSQLLIICTC